MGEPKEGDDESVWGQLYGEEAKIKTEVDAETEGAVEEEESEESEGEEDEGVAIVLDGGSKQGSGMHMKKGQPSEEQYEEDHPDAKGGPEAHPFSLALPNEKVYDIDIDLLPDKPWRKPGADLTDYFNYGFNETTWRNYCKIQIEHRLRDKKMAPAALPSEPEHPVSVEMEPQVKVPIPRDTARRKENDNFRGRPNRVRERSPRADAGRGEAGRGGEVARGGGRREGNNRRFQPAGGRGFERARRGGDDEEEEDENYNAFEKSYAPPFPNNDFRGGPKTFTPNFNSNNAPDSNFNNPNFNPSFSGPPPPNFNPNFTPNFNPGFPPSFTPNFPPNFNPGFNPNFQVPSGGFPKGSVKEDD